MDERAALALRERWWIERRNRPPVHGALVTAVTRCLWSRVQEAMQAHKEQGREPCIWAGLAAALTMNEANLWRRCAGRTDTKLQDLLAIASLLHVSVNQLMPTAETWIERATVLLCGGSISAEEARAYTLYRLSDARGYNPHLDPGALAEIRRQLHPRFVGPRDVEQAILKTAMRIGERLMERGNQA